MKKLLLSIIIVTVFAAGSFAQVRDHVRISWVGFNCNSGTSDNMLELDGKGDEIFIQCNWVMANNNNSTEFEGKYRSPIHGDVNRHSGWIQAGSRSDKGGIQSGDQYRCNTAIGEFDISDGEVLTVVPTIWEWDGNQDDINGFLDFFGGNVNFIKDRAMQQSRSFAQSSGNDLQCVMDMSKVNISPFSMAVNAILGQADDRPIGMNAAGKFSPKSFVLTTNMIRQITQRNLGYGLGVMQLDYDENKLGNTRDHGAYTILIKFEYLGSTGTPITGTVPSTAPHYVPPATTTGTASNGNGSTAAHYVPPPVTNGAGNNASAPSRYIPPPSGNNAGGSYHGSTTINTTPLPNPSSQTAGAAAGNKYPAGQNNPAGRAGGAVVSVPGLWKGTYGNGGSTTDHGYYNFQFNADGTMLMLDPNKTILARGTYTIAGNVLHGTYYWLVGGMYSLTGIMNGNTMTGTWGHNSDESDAGKWILVKQ